MRGLPGQNKTKMTTDADSLINWVNTIPSSFCALVSSADDFADGAVFVALLNHFVYGDDRSHLMLQVKEGGGHPAALSNFGLFVTELLKICDDPFVFGLERQELIACPASRLKTLAFLRLFLAGFQKRSGSARPAAKRLVPLQEPTAKTRSNSQSKNRRSQPTLLEPNSTRELH